MVINCILIHDMMVVRRCSRMRENIYVTNHFQCQDQRTAADVNSWRRRSGGQAQTPHWVGVVSLYQSGAGTMMVVVVLGWVATLRLHFTSLDSGSKADLTRKSNLGQRQVCVIPLCDGQPPPKLPSTHSPTAKCPPFIWYFTFLYYRVSHNFGPTFVFCHFLRFQSTYKGTSDLIIQQNSRAVE